MSNQAGRDLRFDIDRLVVRGQRIFGWGWAADRTRAVRELHLVFDDGPHTRRVAATIGLAREDVARAFPDHASAATAGFVFTGYVPFAESARISLDIAFDDGSQILVAADASADRARTDRAPEGKLRRAARTLWQSLIGARGTSLPEALASLDSAAERVRLRQALTDAQRLRVMFDHDMGGGANEYRRKCVVAWREKGDAVLLVTFRLATLDYRVQLLEPGREGNEMRAPSLLALEEVLRGTRIAELFVNSPVSFDEPATFARWVARLRAEHPEARLTAALHDYFAVCPSFVLLDHAGRYCGIPELSQCESCLPRHQAMHVAFSPPSDIHAWRSAWGAFLEAADEIRCFSRASRELLVKAYPAAARNSTLVPHTVAFAPRRISRTGARGPLVVGVVGQIRFEKGAAMVAGLVREIERCGAEMRVVVIGTLDVAIRSPRLTVTGAYRREELVELVERHKIDVFVFPSIWPETFSFVVSELMALELPIVAFDLGAPAERLREYPAAQLVREVSPEALFEALARLPRPVASQAAA
jgi:glycosyltransferase involved in cell wall biosynthesis